MEIKRHLNLHYAKQFSMEAIKILHSDVLDIIFEGRNKLYGAYDLRKTYNKRLTIALLITSVICAIMLLSYSLANAFGSRDPKRIMIVKDVAIPTAKLEDKKEPPRYTPPKTKPLKVATVTNFVPRIEKDEKVKENERPPDIKQLDSSRIGSIIQQGGRDSDIIHPPIDSKNGVIESLKKKDDDLNERFIPVEKDAEYPGGQEAWSRYLNKNLQYPPDAAEIGIQGPVIVQFIVDKDGNVSNVEAISGPQQLRDEAVRVIRKSGKWTPALQNGRQVKSNKMQPIIFKLQEQ